MSQLLYLKDAAAGVFRALQIVGSVPGTATTATGWIVGTTTTATPYSQMASNVERAASTFSAIAVPPDSGPDAALGDGFRSENVVNGWYAAGSWTIPIPVIRVTAGTTADGRVRVRLWRSPNADGSAATEITSGSQTGSTVTNLTNVEQISTVSVTLAEFGLIDEYLFLSVAWEITGAGGGATDDVNLRVGTSGTITAPDFSAATTTEYQVVLAGRGLLVVKGDYLRRKAQQFAVQLSTSPNAGVRLGEISRVVPSWGGGAGYPTFDEQNPTRYERGYGVDVTSTKDKAQAGPGLTASRSSANNAARVFGIYGGQLYVGYSTGQVDRQTATDTWSAAVGTLTSNVPVGVISYCPQGFHALSDRMLVGASTSTGKVAGYDGTTFTNNAADADQAALTIARITRWTAGAIWTRAYFNIGSFLVLGGRPHSSIVDAYNIGDVNEDSWTVEASCFNTWKGSGVYGTSGQIMAIVPVYGASSSADVLVYAESDLTALKSTIKRVESTAAAYVYSVIREIEDDAILFGVALGTTVYFSTSRGRLYSYDANSAQSDLVLVATTDISPSDANLYGLAVWNEALWVACRDSTKLLVRRYGYSDASDVESDSAWSDPIWGGAIDASATAARQLLAFGGDLYAATEAAGASVIYRMRDGVYNTSAVTLQPPGMSFDSPVVVTSVTVEHSLLVAGDSIQLRYARNGSTTYNTLGTNSTVGSTSTSFPVAASGQVNRLSAQIVITAGSSAATPQLGQLTIAGRPVGNTSREWQITTHAWGNSSYIQSRKNGTPEPRTGQQIIDACWLIMEQGVTQRYRDLDNQIYTVTIDDWEDSPQSELGHVDGLRWTARFKLREV